MPIVFSSMQESYCKERICRPPGVGGAVGVGGGTTGGGAAAVIVSVTGTVTEGTPTALSVILPL